MRAPVRRGRGRTRHSWATVLRPSASGMLALVLSAVACGGGVLTKPASSSSIEVTASPASASPANLSPAATPTSPSFAAVPVREESIAVGGDDRLVDLFEPSVRAGQTSALLVLLHANGESPYVMERTSGIGAVAARDGVFVALPPAREHRWDARISSGDPFKPSADETYVLGLIARLTKDLPIDPDRVFVAGFSMGAVLSERIACRAAGLVAGVVLDAGAPWSDDCAPSRPVAILVMHGTGDGTFRIELADQVVERWRELDRCQGQPVVGQLSEKATSEVTLDCADGTTVQFVRYTGAGHRWFSDPDATDMLSSFIQAGSKP